MTPAASTTTSTRRASTRNGYGLRVPGLVISPYAKSGYIDHQRLSHDAYLKFIEDDFLERQPLEPEDRRAPRPTPGRARRSGRPRRHRQRLRIQPVAATAGAAPEPPRTGPRVEPARPLAADRRDDGRDVDDGLLGDAQRDRQPERPPRHQLPLRIRHFDRVRVERAVQPVARRRRRSRRRRRRRHPPATAFDLPLPDRRERRRRQLVRRRPDVPDRREPARTRSLPRRARRTRRAAWRVRERELHEGR